MTMHGHAGAGLHSTDSPVDVRSRSLPLARVVLLAALIPYIRTSPFEFDNQPHFYVLLIAAIAAYALKTGRLPLGKMALLLSFSAGVSALMLGGGVTAIVLGVLPVAVAYLSRVSGEDIVWACKAALIVYAFGVVIEALFPDVTGTLTSNWRGSEVRGFKSFTSEPSYLGLVGTILAVMFLYLNQRVTWVIGAAALVLLSGSLTAIAPLAAILLAACFRKDRLHWLAAVTIVLAALYHVAPSMDNRIGYLVANFQASPELILADVSFSNRIGRAFAPIHDAWQSGFVPHSFPGETDIEIEFDFLSDGADRYAGRLSSLATVLLYIYGLFALPVVAAYLLAARAPIFIYVTLFYFSVTNISVATPYLYLLLAIPLRKSAFGALTYDGRMSDSRTRVRLPWLSPRRQG